MNFYSLDDKGNLIDRSKLDFDENHVYLIDDIEKKTLYIWVGLKVPQYKKDLTAAWARRFDKDRGGACKILIMIQKREYGSFLSMMEQLKKGLIPGKSTERRPELILSSPKAETTSPPEEKKPEIIDKAGEEGVFAWLTQLKEHRIFVGETREEKVEAEPIIYSEKDEEPLDDEEIVLESQIREADYYL